MHRSAISAHAVICPIKVAARPITNNLHHIFSGVKAKCLSYHEADKTGFVNHRLSRTTKTTKEPGLAQQSPEREMFCPLQVSHVRKNLSPEAVSRSQTHGEQLTSDLWRGQMKVP